MSATLIQAQQVILTGPDGYAKFQTSDGSTFEVYPSSNIIFRKNPGSLRDLLDLFVGRVKIHIQRLGGQPNPNRIMTPTAVISVRGTIFDVSINDDDETTIVSVEEGSVEVRHALKPGAPKIVNAGESLHVYKDEPLAKSAIDKNELCASHRAWLWAMPLIGSPSVLRVAWGCLFRFLLLQANMGPRRRLPHLLRLAVPPGPPRLRQARTPAPSVRGSVGMCHTSL